MLSKLPFEVSCNIIQYLETSELLICSEICKEWRAFIKKRQLIRVLEPMTTNQFHSVIRAIDNKYIDGKQITSLKTTDFPSLFENRFTKLPYHFPNLKHFEYEFLCTSKISHIFKKWQHCLESLSFSGKGSEIIMLLENHHFERLSHLSISHLERTDDLDNNIIAALKNQPQLRSLAIRGDILTFDSLELLHKSLPLLETLELNYATIQFPEGIPLDIVPASKLTHLIRKTRGSHKNDQFLLQYILAKYPSLVYLDLSYKPYVFVTEIMLVLFEMMTKSIQSALVSFISQLPSTLKTFRCQGYATTRAVIDAVAKASNISEFYLSGDSRVCDDIATLQYCYSKSILQSLDRLSVSIWRLQDLETDDEFETSLKELDICCDYSDIMNPREVFHLNRIFKVHPLLESLSIKAVGCEIDISNNIETNQLKIRELNLHVMKLTDPVMSFIKNVMPTLKRLSIKTIAILFQGDEFFGYSDKDDEPDWCVKQEINLPNHCLEYLNICIPRHVHELICSVSSIIDSKRKYYLCFQNERKVKYCGMEPPSIIEKDDKVYHYLDIHCKSLWHLDINDIKMF